MKDITSTAMNAIRVYSALFALSLVVTCAQAGEAAQKIGIAMVNIPAGDFMMGSCKLPNSVQEENKKRAFLGQPPRTVNCSDSDADASDDETPQHRVSIAAFQMGMTEVTLGQFKTFITAAGRSDLVNDDFMKFNAYGDDAPVVGVSWHDAQAFIGWLNKIDGGGYRLPSEAEWEYACRAGSNQKYCGSNDLGAVGWYDKNNSKRQPRRVASKQANAFGLYDMSGNAMEWVQDCWQYTYNGAPSNGSAWSSEQCNRRVLRGGYWFGPEKAARAARRGSNPPNFRIGLSGFRVARTR